MSNAVSGPVWDVLEGLRLRGYEPNDAWPGQDVFDLVVSGIGSVRVVLEEAEARAWVVYRFDQYEAVVWKASFTWAPAVAVLGACGVAEAELALERGGPVTPPEIHTVTDGRCAVCHRDAHRPGRAGPHGHDYQAAADRIGERLFPGIQF